MLGGRTARTRCHARESCDAADAAELCGALTIEEGHPPREAGRSRFSLARAAAMVRAVECGMDGTRASEASANDVRHRLDRSRTRRLAAAGKRGRPTLTETRSPACVSEAAWERRTRPSSSSAAGRRSVTSRRDLRMASRVHRRDRRGESATLDARGDGRARPRGAGSGLASRGPRPVEEVATNA